LQFKKNLILTTFVALTMVTLGQSRADTIEVLELRQVKNHFERNRFWSDSIITLRQQVTFNDPGIIDEEFTQLLTIKLFQQINKTDRKVFDVVKDSSLISCSYDRLSVWNWSEKKTVRTGQVRVISAGKRAVVLKLDLTVHEPGKGTYIYRGVRKFTKTKPLDKYRYVLN
jgi:hypothetical protein